MNEKKGLTILASKEFEYYEDMYKVVDYLNKNLGETDLILGLSEENNNHVITIYKEEWFVK